MKEDQNKSTEGKIKPRMITIRLDKEEYDNLVIKCIELNCSLNSFVRHRLSLQSEYCDDDFLIGSSKRGKKLTDPRIKENGNDKL